MKLAQVLTVTLCLLAGTACTKKSDLSEGMGVEDQPKQKVEQSPATQRSTTEPTAPNTPALEDPETAPSEDPQLAGTTKTPRALDVTDAGR
jgi:hypothetical protein